MPPSRASGAAMRRRKFITLLGGVAAAWPVAAHAQECDRMRRLGVLMAGVESDPQYQADVAVFREGASKARMGGRPKYSDRSSLGRVQRGDDATVCEGAHRTASRPHSLE